MAGPNESPSLSIEQREEVLSRADSLSDKLTDDKVVEIVGRRIEDGIKFWNKELELNAVRENNEQRYLNKNLEVTGDSLYDYQVDYRDNRIFVSVETLASNIVSRIPVPEVIEAQDSDASRELASNFGKVLFRRAEDLHLKGHLQMVARHLLMGYRMGVMKTHWDFGSGRLKPDGTFTGDVHSHFIRPHKIVLDAEAEDPNDIPLIAENIYDTVESIGFQFPDKKDKLLQRIGADKGVTHVGMGTKIGYYEVWYSFFDEDGTKLEGVCWKYKNILLDKGINPYYNYEKGQTNFLDAPAKPYTIFNFLRIGNWALDNTSLTEQAASQQDILEKRGRQIVEAGDQARAAKVFNTMMIDARDAEKYTGDPRQNILAKGDVRAAFARIPPEQLPGYVYTDKLDARTEIDNIFGTHAPLRGEKTESPTLGQEVMSQRSDLGRVTVLTESIENGAMDVYKKMTQVYKVFAKEEQIIKHVGEEAGQTTFIAFSKDKIEDGVEIRIQTGSMSPDDKLTDRNEAVELAKIGGRIDPLSFAEKWHVDKPREFAKRLFYFLFMPDKYASEVLQIGESGGDQDAMQTIQRMQSGENVPPPQNPSKEYVAYFGQFIQSPAFKQLNPEVQRMMVEHIRATVDAAKGGLKEPVEKKPAGGGIGGVVRGIIGGGAT